MAARTTPALYAVCTNHGFGHASRSLAVLRETHRLAPELRIILNTTVPEDFARSMLGDTPVEFRARPLDVGIHQKDFLTMDLETTLSAADALYLQDAGDLLAADEARFLKQEHVGLVLADIPPLAADVAEKAGVACWMLGNFSWDFIYRAYAPQDAAFAHIADRIVASYSKAERLFRPPFSEGASMDAVFSRITNVGLTGGRPRFDRSEVLQRLGLSAELDSLNISETQLVLLSFGGLGLAGIPYAGLAEFDGRRRPRRIFLTFDRGAPPEIPNLRVIADPELRQVDLLPFVERIISKPGHGTFCEVARTGTPFVCLERADFPETPELLRQLRNYFTHRVLSLDQFFRGDWNFITDELSPPENVLRSGRGDLNDSDGNLSIAREIAGHFARV
ncbi:MAG: glycosyl transferase [bacterium]|nr:glycosyl transferase [bacterium]